MEKVGGMLASQKRIMSRGSIAAISLLLRVRYDMHGGIEALCQNYVNIKSVIHANAL